MWKSVVILVAILAAAYASPCSDCVNFRKRVFMVTEDNEVLCMRAGRFNGDFKAVAVTIQDCTDLEKSGLLEMPEEVTEPPYTDMKPVSKPIDRSGFVSTTSAPAISLDTTVEPVSKEEVELTTYGLPQSEITTRPTLDGKLGEDAEVSETDQDLNVVIEMMTAGLFDMYQMGFNLMENLNEVVVTVEKYRAEQDLELSDTDLVDFNLEIIDDIQPLFNELYGMYRETLDSFTVTTAEDEWDFGISAEKLHENSSESIGVEIEQIQPLFDEFFEIYQETLDRFTVTTAEDERDFGISDEKLHANSSESLGVEIEQTEDFLDQFLEIIHNLNASSYDMTQRELLEISAVNMSEGETVKMKNLSFVQEARQQDITRSNLDSEDVPLFSSEEFEIENSSMGKGWMTVLEGVFESDDTSPIATTDISSEETTNSVTISNLLFNFVTAYEKHPHWDQDSVEEIGVPEDSTELSTGPFFDELQKLWSEIQTLETGDIASDLENISAEQQSVLEDTTPITSSNNNSLSGYQPDESLDQNSTITGEVQVQEKPCFDPKRHHLKICHHLKQLSKLSLRHPLEIQHKILAYLILNPVLRDSGLCG